MSLVNSEVAKDYATRVALFCALLFLLIASGSETVYAAPAPVKMPVIVRGVQYGTVTVTSWI